MNKQGLLLCAKYSVAPNYFGYCGPDENKTLVDHLKEGVADKEVELILSEFETLYLNLTLIAKENKIDDVFDKQVVEAYWLGNKLLQNVLSRDYTHLLDEKFKLEKKLGVKKLSKLTYKINSQKIFPHHSFHVFNIFKRTGHDPSFHTLTTMDECRIGWGQVMEVKKNKIIVSTNPLTVIGNRLCFGSPIKKELHLEYKGKKFLSFLKKKDWVSFHWSYVCDVIETQKMNNLFYYTSKAIDFYNS